MARKPKPTGEAVSVLKAAAEALSRDIATNEKRLTELQASVEKTQTAITGWRARLVEINDAIKALG